MPVGCRWAAGEPPPKSQEAQASDAAPLPGPEVTRRAEALKVLEELGPPLVENPDALKRLDPVLPIWIDKDRRRVVMQGVVCQREGPLELFACVQGTKEYESILSVPVKGETVHAALLAIGLERGTPVQFGEKYVAATGPVVEISVIWKGEDGERRRDRAQSWIRNVQTGKAMQHAWVFVGSQLVKSEETGKPVYLAGITGNLICVSNFPDAVLDVTVQSTDSDAALVYEAFTERVPPRGRPVTLVLAPGSKEAKGAERPARKASQAAADE